MRRAILAIGFVAHGLAHSAAGIWAMSIGPTWAVVLGPANLLVFEPAHFVMQRRMLLGIQERAESAVGGFQDIRKGKQS